MFNKKPLLFLASWILIFFAGILIGIGINYSPAPLAFDNTVKTQGQTASLMIDSGESIQTFAPVDLDENDTVFSVLKRLVDENESVTLDYQEYEGLGVFVKSINDKTGENNAWWQYWVNNKYGTIASDKQPLSGGDVVMWKLTGAESK